MEWNLNPGGNNLELEPDDDLDDFTTPMITQTQQKNPKFMCVSERYGREMEERDMGERWKREMIEKS